MLLPIMRSSSRDSACSDSTASPGNSLAAKSSQTLDSFSSFRRRFAPKCLSSQQPTAQRPVGSGRESTLHWLLAAALLKHFGRRPPKGSRARREDLAENLAMLRHVVLNVLRLDKSVFGGISVKRKELAWDDDKLLKLMAAA